MASDTRPRDDAPAQDEKPGLAQRATETLARLRQQHPVLDRVIRMSGHYSKARGNHLAGAITYFGFLSLFPLLAIGFFVLGYVVRVYPDARAQVESFLAAYLPGLTGSGEGQLNVETIAAAGAGVGVIGFLSLLYSGLGFLDALREGLRQMWAVEPEDDNLVVKKLKDVLNLVLIGIAVIVTTALSTVATQLAGTVLDAVGISAGAVGTFALRVLALAVAVLVDTVLLSLVFARLPGHRLPLRNVVSGAFLGAIGIEILKAFATQLLSGTTSNPVYASFGRLVAILVWFNFMARVVMYAAAFAVVGPVPTVEAQVAAEGETLDAGEADSLTKTRKEGNDARPKRPDKDYSTSAGAVPMTTTGIDEEAAHRARAGSAAANGTGPSRGKASPNGGGSAAKGLATLAGVFALIAVRRKAHQEAAAAPADERERQAV